MAKNGGNGGPKAGQNGGNGGNGTRRDSNGLTEKQRMSLPWIAKARSVRAGVRECQALGIVTLGYFYRVWNHEAAYRQAYIAAREKYQGDARELTRSVFLAGAEELAHELMKIALRSRGTKDSDRITAITKALAGAGVDLGSGQNIAITTNVQTGDQGGRSAYGNRLERELADQEDWIRRHAALDRR